MRSTTCSGFWPISKLERSPFHTSAMKSGSGIAADLCCCSKKPRIYPHAHQLLLARSLARSIRNKAHLILIRLLRHEFPQPRKRNLLRLSALLLGIEIDDAGQSSGLEVGRELGRGGLGGGEEGLEVGESALAEGGGEVIEGFGQEVGLEEGRQEGEGGV